ncbi:integrase core domain-containing protein [Nonomuraea sp. SBT364]|uniref:integrase core domain-containing protein n=1 Tax=Nonomuraea sp. SBT364 TaxID=1580530 RepID=UPI00069CBE5C|nr:integrase core domain-containing protein [Nonomuraea sp. SBT364]
MNQAGIDPAPHRSGPTWKQFLTAQAEHIVAVAFLHVDTINLKRIYALVLLEHRSRRTHLLGVTANPTGEWTAQAARNFLMDTDTTNIKFLIRDRAGQFAEAFDTVFTDAGLRVLKSPPQAPKANAHCERMIGTLRRELLDRMLILDERHLRRTLTRYLEHSAFKDGDLVTQDENLHVLVPIAHGEQPQRGDRVRDGQIGQA